MKYNIVCEIKCKLFYFYGNKIVIEMRFEILVTNNYNGKDCKQKCRRILDEVQI